jgi:methylenetetrahydrofolate dehydrogenase (NADP+)/methenyltetrahydrofolate cyclohydrolase
MNILNGKETSITLNDALKDEIKTLTKDERQPKLAVILVGNHPASLSYIKGKLKAASRVGIETELFQLGNDASNDDVLAVIENLNKDDAVDGMILQLPLPKQLHERKLIEAISQYKDADGFHTFNQGNLYQSIPGIVPATPLGIMKLLKAYDINVSGMNAVVIGRSNIVGFPTARLLMDRGATVTICHSKTKNIDMYTKEADIIVVAVGKPNMLMGNMIKKDAIIIDVGINRVNGKLIGDANFESIKDRTSWITPVPGGVGPMTIHGLLSNTVELYKKHVKIN